MPVQPDDLEALWGELLSRQPALVQNAFLQLTTEEQQAVAAHLKRMAIESGWHMEQRKSAQAALDAIKEWLHQDS